MMMMMMMRVELVPFALVPLSATPYIIFVLPGLKWHENEDLRLETFFLFWIVEYSVSVVSQGPPLFVREGKGEAVE
jgi:hypothetical protein